MEYCIIGAVYLNYDDIIKRQKIESLLREIKILLLSPNNARPYFQLPMIRMQTKQNKLESIKDGIRKTFGVKSKHVLRMTEVNVSIDKHRSKSMLFIVFFNAPGYEERIENSEFVSISNLDRVSMGEQSTDYVNAIKKWIMTESMNSALLLDWFKPYKRGEASPFKSKRQTLDSSLERQNYNPSTDIFYKSTSLEAIVRPASVNNVSYSRQQADSLDRISEKDKAHTPREMKNAIKSKITKPKPLSISGPISAVPLQETVVNNVKVMINPLLIGQLDFGWHSDVVVRNPFWNQSQQPDLSKIGVQSKTLFLRDKFVFRSRVWATDFPLHCAAYRGDMGLVTSLIDHGYSCMDRDHAGWTPLHYAVWYGYLDMVALFLRFHLVTVNRRTADSFTPLHLALIRRQSTITDLLLQQPDIDPSLKTSTGEGARALADKYDGRFMVPLIKLVSPKLSRMQVTLMDNSVKTVPLPHGSDTTIHQLRLQMIDMMDVDASCCDVFSFWIGYRSPRFTGKMSVVPSECFGPGTMSLKELDTVDYRLFWRRNLFLGLDRERTVKCGPVLALLFAEAKHNYTAKSHYPCEANDIALLSSVLLHGHLPPFRDGVRASLRALSLSTVHRPLSFVLGSKMSSGQSRQMSASMHTLEERRHQGRGTTTTTSVNDLTEAAPAMDERTRHAKAFLSSYKNLALVLPKKKLKDPKVNWPEEIIKRFTQSSFSFRNYSVQERQYRFLTLCWNLTLYGCAYFHVEIKLSISIPFTDCILAINDMGIYFLHARTKNLIENFKYSTITWHPSVADKCLLLFTKRKNIYIKTRQSLMISDLMLRLHSINV